MIIITIDSKPYHAVYRWEDLSLGKFIELSRIEMPEKLKALYVTSASMNTPDARDKKKAREGYKIASEAILPADLRKHFPEYYGKVIGLLSDIPKEVIDIMDAELRATLYDNYFKGFVMSLVYNSPVDILGGKIIEYNPPEVTSFEIGGEEFFFPESLKIGGDLVPMAHESILSFSEASEIDLAIQDLMDEGVSKFPLFMAVYCRKKNEQYSEGMVLEREPLFNNVTMDIAWSLFFYTGKLITALSRSLALFSREAVRQVIRGQVDLLTSGSGG